MSRINQSFQPPQYWQQFEDLTVGLVASIYGDRAAQKVGRPGQAQNGVDVTGYDRDKKLIAVQCKRREETDENNDPLPGGVITEKFFDDATEEASSFKPTPETWILATTAKADKAIQEHARKRTAELGRTVQVWGWDFINNVLNSDHELQKRYYDQILKTDPEAQDREILELFAEAFQREAFRMPVQRETPHEFVDALKDVQHAISTGELKDRETRRLIRRAPGGWRMLSREDVKASVTQSDRALHDLREAFRRGEERGQIRPCGALLDIEWELRDELERLRNSAIEHLNDALAKVGLEPLRGVGNE
ncbi:MAG TPA: hypothetical protein PLA92_04390 [Fimbriimonadaceae bacterium]|nr:hypothetical protein [Fimbriimonadaceae bacterium]